MIFYVFGIFNNKIVFFHVYIERICKIVAIFADKL